MPEGSSSAAPVTKPGPSNRKNMFLGFLGGPEDADSVISHLRTDPGGHARRDQRFTPPIRACRVGTAQEEESCNDRRQPRLAVDDNRPTGHRQVMRAPIRPVVKARRVGDRWSAVAARGHPPRAPLT